MGKKFWNWVVNEQNGNELRINGFIAEESWWFDDVTPRVFREELSSKQGDITVWINSPGGECVAASQIYTMLKEHDGKVTVKIDGLAASAASVIAMAGDEILMAPTALAMIHNPLTYIYGEVSDLEKGIDLLNEVKESIVNAYQLKTGLSRAKISHLMDTETWLNAKAAIELGFADGMLYDGTTEPEAEPVTFNRMTAAVATTTALRKRLFNAGERPKPLESPPSHQDKQPESRKNQSPQQSQPLVPTGIPICMFDKRLELLKR